MNPILLTTDENFAQHCGVCITSLLKNNPNVPFDIVVAGMGLSDRTKEMLAECVAGYAGVSLTMADFQADKLKAFPQIGAYRKNIYLRLWVEEFFSTDVTYVLYLDVDTLVVDNIESLFHPDTDDFVIGAVDIPFADCHDRCDLPPDYGYFNSGVLLFNLPRWRQQQCRQQLLDFLIKNQEIASNPDQDALNGVLYKQRLTLDYTYNVIAPFFRRYDYLGLGETELSRIRTQAKIVHFNGLSRPWLYSSNHPYQGKYFDYLKMTPWRSFIPRDKTVYNGIKKRLRVWLGKESFVRISAAKGA